MSFANTGQTDPDEPPAWWLVALAAVIAAVWVAIHLAGYRV